MDELLEAIELMKMHYERLALAVDAWEDKDAVLFELDQVKTNLDRAEFIADSGDVVDA